MNPILETIATLRHPKRVLIQDAFFDVGKCDRWVADKLMRIANNILFARVSNIMLKLATIQAINILLGAHPAPFADPTLQSLTVLLSEDVYGENQIDQMGTLLRVFWWLEVLQLNPRDSEISITLYGD